MVQANELRIGNWLISAKTDEPFKVDSIPNDAEITAQPIELSPELLVEACGFEKDGIQYSKNNVVILSYLTIFKYYYNIGVVDFSRVRYLHQLQNLYFALTSEELLINKEALDKIIKK